MLAFILWAVGTFNLGLIAENAPLSEVMLHMRLQLSGVILALTFFVFFALSFTKAEEALKNPITYLIAIPSIYLLYMIWTSEVSSIERTAFSTISGTKSELFIFSTIFGVGGIYLLFRHYATSKYRDREQSKLMLAGAITAILVAVTINIILPMFFNIYFLALSTLAPAVMGIFLATLLKAQIPKNFIYEALAYSKSTTNWYELVLTLVVVSSYRVCCEFVVKFSSTSLACKVIRRRIGF